MVDPIGFAKVRLPQSDTSFAINTMQASLMGRAMKTQDEAKQFSDAATIAWSKGDDKGFRTAIAKLAAIDKQQAAGMITTLGQLDRTNFVESAYHVYNAANSKDPKAINMSLIRAADTLGVQPGHPMAQSLRELAAMPEGDEKNRAILTAYNYANQLGAYGNSMTDQLAAQKLAIQQGNLQLRWQEFMLAKDKESRIAARQKFIDDYGEVPENFYRDPDDPKKLKSKPGSITYETRMQEMNKRIKLYDDNISKGNRLKGQIEQALNDTNMWTSGTLGNFLKYIPGLPASDLNSIVKTITANIGFDKLQDMRLQSPTGGALGQVAIQELEALQASISNLEQSQSPPQLRQNLQMVYDHYTRFLNSAKKAKEELKGMGPDDLYSQSNNRLLSEDPTGNLQDKSTKELVDLF